MLTYESGHLCLIRPLNQPAQFMTNLLRSRSLSGNSESKQFHLCANQHVKDTFLPENATRFQGWLPLDVAVHCDLVRCLHRMSHLSTSGADGINPPTAYTAHTHNTAPSQQLLEAPDHY